MPRRDLPEDYAVRQLRQSVRDSLSAHGEEVIILALYRPSADQDTQPRCPVCFNDVYNQPEDQECTQCWGTTFSGGVKIAARIWALFTDMGQNEEKLGKHGVYSPDNRSVQLEYPPLVSERDILIRVRRWDVEHRPLEVEGFYYLGKSDPTSLRTGNRFGQYGWDLVGQRAPVSRLDDSSHVITKYPVIGRVFDRLDGRLRSDGSLTPSPYPGQLYPGSSVDPSS